MSVYHSCFSFAASFVLEVVACYVCVFLQRFRQSKQSKVPFLFLFLTLLLDWVPSVEIFRFNPEKKKRRISNHSSLWDPSVFIHSSLFPVPFFFSLKLMTCCQS